MGAAAALEEPDDPVTLPDPVTAEPTTPTPPDPVVEELEKVADRLDELARLQRHNASLVDRLHAENQRLRSGEIAQAVAPLIRDVIRVHDDVQKLQNAAPNDGGTDDLALVRRSLLEVLSRAGVEAFVANPGDSFDPVRHNGLRGLEADAPDLVGTVAEMMRAGFAYTSEGGRVLRPADVAVFRPARPKPDLDDGGNL